MNSLKQISKKKNWNGNVNGDLIGIGKLSVWRLLIYGLHCHVLNDGTLVKLVFD